MKKRSIVSVALILVVAVVGYAFAENLPVFAASTYTVNSIGDASDDNPGDDICETATPGECTFRAAIEEANAHANSGGNDVINFGISGSGLHTFQPASAYDGITDGVTINGYSQTGATANTAVSPNPLNGTLTIELDGQNAGSGANGLVFVAGSDDSIVRGLIVNRFNSGGMSIQAPNIIIAGNYIGTDATGLVAEENFGTGVGSASNVNGSGLRIGGLDPADRNLISGNGNTDGQAGINPNEDSDNWLIQGNYIGVDKTGVTALGNSSSGGSASGGLSIDFTDGVTVGGTAVGAANVVSGNYSFGFAIAESSNTTIQGNLIGTDYTGTQDLGNGSHGIHCGDCSDLLVGGSTVTARNVVSGNDGGGVSTNRTTDATIQGNYIGTDITATWPLGNTAEGVAISGSSNVAIGGTTPGTRNVVSANFIGVSVASLLPFGGDPANNNVVQGNYIGTNGSGQVESGFGNTGAGVMMFIAPADNLIGGTVAGSGNLIAGNGAGIIGAGFVGSDTNLNNSFLGNSIYGNSDGPISTLGIDLAETPDGSTYQKTGVTSNDVGDPDDGTNHYMNFPVISAISSSNGEASITYSLDINDSEAGATGYRVEFFANDTADPSGHGQGQTFLGYDTVAGDVTNHTANISLPSGVSGAKFITAVTTMTDSSTDGFGHSSEFASNYQAVLAAASSDSGSGGSESSSLADTGSNVNTILALVAVLLITGAAGFRVAQKRQ